METQITIGGCTFAFESEYPIRIDDAVRPFITTGTDSDPVNIRVIHNASPLPQPSVLLSGEDLLAEHYLEQNRRLSLTKGGLGTYLAAAVSNPDYSDIVCYLKEETESSLNSIAQLLRVIPMQAILQHRDTMFLHSSQISIGGKGILFSAASGTGKTTQAKLWQKHRNARIICNDRTLIREGKTYGYPVDGSEPVYSSEVLPLGAVVLLKQSPENHIRRVRPSEAVARMVPQMVIDRWDPAAAQRAVEQIIALLGEYPVYILGCTPDERAVKCLEEQLIKDGVLKNEQCTRANI